MGRNERQLVQIEREKQEQEREKWFEEEKRQFGVRRELQEHADDLAAKLTLAEEQLTCIVMEQQEQGKNKSERKESEEMHLRHQEAKWARKERKLLGNLEPG